MRERGYSPSARKEQADATFLPLDVYGDVQRIERIFVWFVAAIWVVLTNRDTLFAVIIAVSIPPARRGRNSLYCSILYFGPNGRYLGKHRKLKPTASERLVWGEGDGSTLTALDTEYGMICGLADQRESWQSTMAHIACEGRTNVPRRPAGACGDSRSRRPALPRRQRRCLAVRKGDRRSPLGRGGNAPGYA